MHRKIRFAAPAALLVVLGIVLFFVRAHREMVDFEVNDTAGKRLGWGETLYRLEDGHYQFKYPPFAAMIYLPLSGLPLPAAKAAWFFLILAASAAALILAAKLAARGRESPAWLAWVPFIVLVRYFLRELQLGQINALITFILMAMAGLLIRSENRKSSAAEAGAGLLWGLSVALKPYALIFLPYLILKRKLRALGAGLVFLAGAFVLPSLFYGFSGNWAVHGEWVRTLSRSTPHLLTSQDNASLLALFNKWTGRPDLSFTLWAVSLIILATLMFVIVRLGRSRPDPVPLDIGLLLLLIPLISPLGWDYTFLSSVLAVSLIGRHWPDLKLPARAGLALTGLVIALSLYDVLGREIYARFMSLSVITLCFLVLAGFAAALRFKRLC